LRGGKHPSHRIVAAVVLVPPDQFRAVPLQLDAEAGPGAPEEFPVLAARSHCPECAP
jgi:hypothetical protein